MRLSLSLSLSLSLAFGAELHAQSPGGVHPSVAPPPPGFLWPAGITTTLGIVHPGRSPALNHPDGNWNHGESALATDQGGIFGMNLGNQVTPLVPVLGTHVHKFVLPNQSTPEGWVPVQAGSGSSLFPTTTLLRLRGHLGPALLNPGTDEVPDAAFEVLVDTTFDPSLPTAIVISTPGSWNANIKDPTDGNGDDIGLRFAYPGFDSDQGAGRNDGIPHDHAFRAAGDQVCPTGLVDYFIDDPTSIAALEHAVTQTNLHVVQHARPAAPLLLVAAGLTPTPWPVAGVPVWLDPFPAPLTTEFALAPPNGQRVRDIPIPPGIPSGTRFAMQSFELLPTGELLTSNVTSMGLW